MSGPPESRLPAAAKKNLPAIVSNTEQKVRNVPLMSNEREKFLGEISKELLKKRKRQHVEKTQIILYGSTPWFQRLGKVNNDLTIGEQGISRKYKTLFVHN